MNAEQQNLIEKILAESAGAPIDALDARFRLVPIERATMFSLFDAFNDEMWGEEGYLDVNSLASEEERAQSKAHSDRYHELPQLCLAIFEGDSFVGWFWGRQEVSDEFHMVNTALLPGYRGQGLYTKLLAYLLKRIQAMGFRSVVSHHHPDNPGILIPKLKAGFVITGFRLYDNFGLLVQLCYWFNPAHREAFGFRTGRLAASERVRSLLAPKEQ